MQDIEKCLKIRAKDIVTYYEDHETLTEKLRKQMCDIIVDAFLIEKHGAYPSSAEKHAIATAAANYFKCYKIRKEDTEYKGGVSVFF